ncbi:MAG: sel1 repeat family protein, partial [Gammaproteobacteria bacterium]|nr:sel1 repeat family protein [Gammaproteobacteria bacterium]
MKNQHYLGRKVFAIFVCLFCITSCYAKTNKLCPQSDDLVTHEYLHLIGTIDTTKIKTTSGFEVAEQKALTPLINKPEFSALKKIAHQNDECGAKASVTLFLIYSQLKNRVLTEKYHQKLLKFAKNNKHSTYPVLCYDHSGLTKNSDVAYACEKIVNSRAGTFGKPNKQLALLRLSGIYFDQKSVDKLINLCINTTDKRFQQGTCSSGLFALAGQFDTEKNYSQKFKILYSLAQFDDSGLSQAQLGDMYFRGEGVSNDPIESIVWNIKALGKLTDNAIRVLTIQQIGAAYAQITNYVMAFKYFHQAALMGYPLAQANL